MDGAITKCFLLSLLIGALVLLQAVPSEAWWKKVYEGRVVDAETGKPIEGAVVLAYWIKQTPMFFHPHFEFYDAREVLTDRNGYFQFDDAAPWLRWPLVRYWLHFHVLKAGYAVVGRLGWDELRAVREEMEEFEYWEQRWIQDRQPKSRIVPLPGTKISPEELKERERQEQEKWLAERRAYFKEWKEGLGWEQYEGREMPVFRLKRLSLAERRFHGWDVSTDVPKELMKRFIEERMKNETMP